MRLFNLLVGNDDCHLKNLSFIVQPGTITLAPPYDMLATGVFQMRAKAGVHLSLGPPKSASRPWLMR